MLARGQQRSKPFDNLSAFRPCIFMNTLSISMGISDFTMRVAPIILFLRSTPPPPPFSLFSKSKYGSCLWAVSSFVPQGSIENQML